MRTTKRELVFSLVLAVGLTSGCGIALLCLTGTVNATDPAKSAEPTTNPPATDLDKAWTDLAGNDDAAMVRAVLTLGMNAKDAVPFLKDRLRPVVIDPQRVQQLIADLDHQQFPLRNKATEELEYLGKHAKPYLEKGLAAKPSAEAAQRINQLLQRIAADEPAKPKAPPQGGGNGVQVQVQVVNGVKKIMINGQEVDGAPKASAVGPSPLWQRAARAIAVLEHIGTPEARQVLETLTSGEPEALPTKEAKAALQRLDKK